MKFRQATITAIVALSSALGTTPTLTTAAPHHRRRRSLEAKNSNAATQTNQKTTPSVLAAQTGTECFLSPTIFTDVYTLVVNGINPVTTLFDERPQRHAGTLLTANFTENFATNFGADPPNAAITILGGTAHHDALLIVTLSNPSMSVDGSGITYTVAQSSSQAGVLSLESVYERQVTSSDNSCSIFIDGYSGHFTKKIVCVY